MNLDSAAFEYDDFEQYLLDAAAIDEAPSDLPRRLGVALGLGVPILAASELASLAPTTTSLHGFAGASGSIAPTGLFGSLKATLGAGASTLFGTATKGVAVGLICGTAAVGTGRAVAKLTGIDAQATQVTAANSMQHRDTGAPTEQAPAALPAAAAVPAPATNAQTETVALNPTPDESLKAGPNHTRVVTTGRVGFGDAPRALSSFFVDRSSHETPADVDKAKPRMRLAHPIFPERTYAIARYPILWDDVSAYYDTPKKPASLPAVASFAVEPSITPAEVAALRSRTIQQSRTLLGQSKPALALAGLDEFRTRVGDRYFGVDELLLRIEALALMGHAKEAQAEVKNVERLAPNSAALRQAQQLAASRFVR